jgi:hypothetical protein
MARRNEDCILVEKAQELAIRKYIAWLERNPKASHEKKVKKFDEYCDSALLQELVNG